MAAKNDASDDLSSAALVRADERVIRGGGARAKSKMLTQGITQIRDCLALARARALLRPRTRAASSCIETGGYAEPLDDTLRRELERQYAHPKVYGAALSEYGGLWPEAGEVLSVDDREIDAAGVEFGDRPLIVLTRGNPQTPPPGIAPAHAAPVTPRGPLVTWRWPERRPTARTSWCRIPATTSNSISRRL